MGAQANFCLSEEYLDGTSSDCIKKKVTFQTWINNFSPKGHYLGNYKYLKGRVLKNIPPQQRQLYYWCTVVIQNKYMFVWTASIPANRIWFSEMHLNWTRQEIQPVWCFPCIVVSTADLNRKISGFFCTQDCRILNCMFPWLNAMFQFDLQQKENNLTLKCLVINPFWACIAAHSNFTYSHYQHTCLLGELASANVKSHYNSCQILLAFSSFLWNPPNPRVPSAMKDSFFFTVW